MIDAYAGVAARPRPAPETERRRNPMNVDMSVATEFLYSEIAGWLVGIGCCAFFMWAADRVSKLDGEIRAETAPLREYWRTPSSRAAMVLSLFVFWPVVVLWFAWTAVVCLFEGALDHFKDEEGES
jgi:hypothetical protein